MAKKYKSNKVYYYQIKPSYSSGSDKDVIRTKRYFKDALKFNKDNLTSVYQGDGSVSAVVGEEIDGRYIGGALIYTMENNIPPKWDSVKKTPASIDLVGFSGLGYDAAYFYDSENMIIAIESRVPGPTLASLRELILLNYEVPGFNYLPVSSEKTYEQFLDTPGVTSLEMSMLNIESAKENKRTVPGISESKEMVDEANGHKIVINISAGRNKSNYLNKGYVKRMADWAVNSFGGKNEVSKFKLKIVDLDSGKINPIDLISGRISDKTEIEKVRAINQFSIKEKIGQIEEKYLKRRPYLDNLYKL